MSTHRMTAIHRLRLALVMAAGLLCASPANADVVTDWSVHGGTLVTTANLGAYEANRVLALAHTAAYEAANAITVRYPRTETGLRPQPGASVDAAISAAHRAVLSALMPTLRTAIDQVYEAKLNASGDKAGLRDGIAVGEQAAAAVLGRRAGDSAVVAEPATYRPQANPGQYVPTSMPVASQWSKRTPWLMSSASQFLPRPPPALTGEVWARDLNEVKAFGGRNSSVRSAEQTAIARFWEATLPPIYHGVVRSVASAPGRDVMRNARLFAAVTQAVDDAMIAVFDAKYHHGFWRPITAIRNADIDGNDATGRDSSWLPFIETPMHPEYPCAHCIVSAAIGTVLQADIGANPLPVLVTSSPTANGAVRSWTSIEAFIQEVANARIYDGVHYRTSTEVGTTMGRQVGALAVDRFLGN